MTTHPTPTPALTADRSPDTTSSLITGDEHARRIAAVLRKRSFCTLATVSDAGFPHSAGVVYAWADGAMWIHTMRSSRKARNIAHDERVAVTVPFRRMPVGPPFTLHFQARAALVRMDAPSVRTLLASGGIGAVAGHGALDEPDGVFVRILPSGAIHTYGPGARMIDLIRDPLHSGQGRVDARHVVDS